ncbi:hypothetical protein MS5N3_11520 [Marinobacter salsuginis]|uniref:Uncharacterized protein n=1 Tax=Marinobacter salsuginis TaxID=418719 RepID=A0A5M3PLB0_9GAMM|nr:hypothetical protein MS5N3_11520 [Marinobacter salsuginis]
MTTTGLKVTTGDPAQGDRHIERNKLEEKGKGCGHRDSVRKGGNFQQQVPESITECSSDRDIDSVKKP